MSAVTLNTVQGQTGTQASNSDAWQNLNLETFVKLLVTEMQNQDPMSPMNNSEILQQISQIQSIQSTSKLTSTLQSVLLGQNVSTAGSLLGRTVTGLTDGSNPQTVTGQVDRVTIAGGLAKLQVGNDTISLTNVSAILPVGG